MEKVNKSFGFFKQLMWGVRQYPEALSFMVKHKLYWLFLFPLVFNFLLFYFGFSAVNQVSTFVVEWIKSYIDFDGFGEDTTGFFNVLLEVGLWILFKIMFLFLYAYIGGYVVIIFLSPFLSYVSELAERKNGGNIPKFKLGDFFKNIFRGVVIALRSFFYQTIISAFILMLGFVPIVNFSVPILLFVVSAFFYGFSFMDYFLERRISSISESVDYVKKHRIITTSLGLPFVFVLAIPYIGSFLAGFVTIVGTIAATISLMEEEKLQITQHG